MLFTTYQHTASRSMTEPDERGNERRARSKRPRWPIEDKMKMPQEDRVSPSILDRKSAIPGRCPTMIRHRGGGEARRLHVKLALNGQLSRDNGDPAAALRILHHGPPGRPPQQTIPALVMYAPGPTAISGTATTSCSTVTRASSVARSPPRRRHAWDWRGAVRAQWGEY